jgi:hypothetical protein
MNQYRENANPESEQTNHQDTKAPRNHLGLSEILNPGIRASGLIRHSDFVVLCVSAVKTDHGRA